MDTTITHAYLVRIIRMLETVPDVVLSQFASYNHRRLLRYVDRLNRTDPHAPITIHPLPTTIQRQVWRTRVGRSCWSVHATIPKQLPHLCGMYHWLGTVLRFLHHTTMLTMWHVVTERRTVYTTARTTTWIVPDMVLDLAVTPPRAAATVALPLVDIPAHGGPDRRVGRWMVEWERAVHREDDRIRRKWSRYAQWAVVASATTGGAPLPCVLVVSPSRAWLHRAVTAWNDVWNRSFPTAPRPTLVGLYAPYGAQSPEQMPVITHADTWPTFAAMLRDLDAPLYTSDPFPALQGHRQPIRVPEGVGSWIVPPVRHRYTAPDPDGRYRSPGADGTNHRSR